MFAVLIFGMPMVMAQNPSAPPADQPASHQMSMSAMVDDCQKHCQATSAALDEITKTIAEAKKSSNVSTLHAALDQVQTRVTAIGGQATVCHTTMGTMPNMMSMPGGMPHDTMSMPDMMH